MFYGTKLSATLILTALLFLVASCASIKIELPGSEVQSILILPYTYINTSGSPRGYYYQYGIAAEGDRNNVYEAKFNQSAREGFLIVDALSPGYYNVVQLTTIPVGTGGRKYKNIPYVRSIRFRLESGKITIFHRSLDISQVKHAIESGSWISKKSFSSVSREQKNRILEKLEKQENFYKWEISE